MPVHSFATLALACAALASAGLCPQPRIETVIVNAAAQQSNETLAQLIFRASACCLHLLKTLNNYSPPGVDDVTLKLHMGIGAGTLSSFYLGGWEGKWEYFVAGEPIEQVPPLSPPLHALSLRGPDLRRAYSLAVHATLADVGRN